MCACVCMSVMLGKEEEGDRRVTFLCLSIVSLDIVSVRYFCNLEGEI